MSKREKRKQSHKKDSGCSDLLPFIITSLHDHMVFQILTFHNMASLDINICRIVPA